MSAVVCAVAFASALAAPGGAAADTVSVVSLRLGEHGDVPITGDWTGSGRTQIGVYRPSNRTFYLGDNNGTAQTATVYGASGDTPITGDWTGSGRTQIGVYRPSNRTFYLGDNSGTAQTSMVFGNSGDLPIAGDWTGTGKTQIGVYRPSNRTFYLGDVNGAAPTVIQFGDSGDVPIAGDWTGTGRTQIGVYRPSNETFYLREVSPSPPRAPVVTAPVITRLPAPPRGGSRRRRVRVRITMSWTWDRSWTRLQSVSLGRLPRDGRVLVTCKGRGCPGRRAARASGVKGLLRRLTGSRYRAGDRILITISAPGRVSERASIKIRNGRLPLARLL